MEWIINQRVISYGQWAISLQRHYTVLLQFRHSIQLSSHSFNHSTIELHVIEQIRSPDDSRVIHRHSTLYRRWRTSAGAGGRWEWAAMVWAPNYTKTIGMWYTVCGAVSISVCFWRGRKTHAQPSPWRSCCHHEWMNVVSIGICVCVCRKVLVKSKLKKKKEN